MSSSASATMQFNGIDESDAERLLGAIWPILEKHDLPKPLLYVRTMNARIDITLTFQSAGDRAVVEKEFAGYIFGLRSTDASFN